MIKRGYETLQQFSKGVDKILPPPHTLANLTIANFSLGIYKTYHPYRILEGELILKSFKTLPSFSKGVHKISGPLKH